MATLLIGLAVFSMPKVSNGSFGYANSTMKNADGMNLAEYNCRVNYLVPSVISL